MKDFISGVSIPTIAVTFVLIWAVNNARPLRDVKRIVY